MADTLTDDLAARVGVLSQRVATTETAIVEMRKDMHSQLNAITTSISNLATKIEERAKPQWQAIAVGLSAVTFFLASIGFLVYTPINTRLFTLETSTVARSEIDWRSQRGAEDRARTDAAIADLRAEVIPKAELDQRFQNMADRNADIQRQLEKIVADLGQLYPIKDVFSELQARLSRLEMLRLRDQDGAPTP